MSKSHLIRLLIFISVISVTFPLFFEKAKAIDQTNTTATELIGQPNFNTNIPLLYGLHLPLSVNQVGNRLFVADSGPCRVVVYNNAPTSNYPTADYVIGQPYPNIACASYEIPMPTRTSLASSVTSNGTKLIVSDGGNNRILIWNTIPTTNEIPADIVLGQPDMYSRTANNGGLSASSIYAGTSTAMAYVNEVYTDGIKLYFTDTANNRVLIWNSIPTVNNTPADVVVGQPNFSSNTANNGGITDHTLSSPRGVKVINNKLYISDGGNNRILIFNTVPTSNNASANIVLGQPDMISGTSNNGGLSAHSLKAPQAVNSYDGKLYIADYGNNRVLVFNTIPSGNNASADIALGQPDLVSGTSNNGGVSSSSLSGPMDAKVLGGKLYISDRLNQRVVVHNSLTLTNNKAADIVLGHANFTRVNTKDGGDQVFNSPYFSITDDGKLIVADYANNRVLIWNTIPVGQYPLDPDVVLGQPNMTSITANYGGVSASSLNYPKNPLVCGDKLLVADYMNRRALIWNTIPTTNNAPANVVIGQPDFTTTTPNTGGVSASSLYGVDSIACIGNKLVLGDWGNYRFLIYNSIPTENHTAANVVIGQSDMISRGKNTGGISAHSFGGGVGSASSNGTNLVIPDYENNRVLIWNTIPTTNGADADLVLGQPDMTTGTANNGGISASSISRPYNTYIHGTRLFVVDNLNNRVLGWNTIPTSNFQAADFVLGQNDFTHVVDEISAERLFMPFSLDIYNDRIYISDWNNRIVSFPFGAQNTNVEAPDLVADNDISLLLQATGAKEMKVWEDGGSSSAVWVPYSSSKNIVLSQGDGTKHIYVKYRDYADYEGSVLSANTVLDTTAPTGSIVILSPNSNGYTNSSTVTLKLDGVDTVSGVKKMMISNSSKFTGAVWETYSTSKSYKLSSGDGIKTVYVKYKDAAGNVSVAYGASITLDTTTTEFTIGKVGDTQYDSSMSSYSVITDTPVITGTGEPGSTITIENGEDVIGTALVDETGNWSFTPANDLTNGTYNLTMTVEDKAGNKEVKGLIMIVNTSEEKKPLPDNSGKSSTTDNNKGKDKKEIKNSSYWYLLLLIIIIIVVVYSWYKSSKRRTK